MPEEVAPLGDAIKGKDIPNNARWTKIDRRLVSPDALDEARERFEERLDCVIVLRVLTKKEIQQLADRTQEIRLQRLEGRTRSRSRDWGLNADESSPPPPLSRMPSLPASASLSTAPPRRPLKFGSLLESRDPTTLKQPYPDELDISDDTSDRRSNVDRGRPRFVFGPTITREVSSSEDDDKDAFEKSRRIHEERKRTGKAGTYGRTGDNTEELVPNAEGYPIPRSRNDMDRSESGNRRTTSPSDISKGYSYTGPAYLQGPAVVQPSAARRRSSSTTRQQRPMSFSGEPGEYWVPGMPAPYPSSYDTVRPRPTVHVMESDPDEEYSRRLQEAERVRDRDLSDSGYERDRTRDRRRPEDERDETQDAEDHSQGFEDPSSTSTRRLSILKGNARRPSRRKVVITKRPVTIIQSSDPAPKTRVPAPHPGYYQ